MSGRDLVLTKRLPTAVCEIVFDLVTEQHSSAVGSSRIHWQIRHLSKLCAYAGNGVMGTYATNERVLSCVHMP